MVELLERKVDTVLSNWRQNPDRKPMIIKGARQVGKTKSVNAFAKRYYKSVVQINFVEQPKFKNIFDDGYEVNVILKNISLLAPSFQFIPGDTLFFFDELQECPKCATSLKFFKLDGRYDVICSGSLMGINYKEIESNSVGYKEEYEMHSMDFEEFLWAMNYSQDFVEELYNHMKELRPLSELQLNTLFGLFKDYMVLGGMPDVIKSYVNNKNFSGTLALQRQLLVDYDEDITKYAVGLDKAKIRNVYNHISVFLAKENKRFQISKVGVNARNRDYVGVVEWLSSAGIINPCYCLADVELPLKGNYDPKLYKIYFKDTGLLIASLDEEAQNDLRANRNFGTYKGAIYENIVGDMLAKQGYNLYYYKQDNPALEMDFFVRDADSLIPVEVKAKDGVSASLRKLVDSDKYGDIKYGIKLGYKNIGFNGQFYTFPYFLTFLLKRFLRERV
ncbi:MAG: ATP-binding protein [Bacteroidaceae bacterium]|nr:ATP-binding protein [Bacteroidaceae bacterium]